MYLPRAVGLGRRRDSLMITSCFITSSGSSNWFIWALLLKRPIHGQANLTLIICKNQKDVITLPHLVSLHRRETKFPGNIPLLTIPYQPSLLLMPWSPREPGHQQAWFRILSRNTQSPASEELRPEQNQLLARTNCNCVFISSSEPGKRGKQPPWAWSGFFFSIIELYHIVYKYTLLGGLRPCYQIIVAFPLCWTQAGPSSNITSPWDIKITCCRIRLANGRLHTQVCLGDS